MTTNNNPVNIGDRLLGVNQGDHASLEHGENRGGGVFKIFMKDGGGGPNFDMVFKLTGGGSSILLTRIDAPHDEPTNLRQGGDRRLLGRDYNLKFE